MSPNPRCRRSDLRGDNPAETATNAQAIAAAGEVARVQFVSAAVGDVDEALRREPGAKLQRIEEGEERLACRGDTPRQRIEGKAFDQSERSTRNRVVEDDSAPGAGRG